MDPLHIVNIGSIRTDAKLENAVQENFRWFKPYTTVDGDLVDLSGGTVNYDRLIGTLVRRKKNRDPTLIVTSCPIFRSDMDLESYVEVVGGGISFFKSPHKIAVVSSIFAGRQTDVITKAVHEIAHWHSLSHHWLNPRVRFQCPMVVPKYSGGPAEPDEIGTILCGLCQTRPVMNSYRKG